MFDGPVPKTYVLVKDECITISCLQAPHQLMASIRVLVCFMQELFRRLVRWSKVHNVHLGMTLYPKQRTEACAGGLGDLTGVLAV